MKYSLCLLAFLLGCAHTQSITPHSNEQRQHQDPAELAQKIQKLTPDVLQKYQAYLSGQPHQDEIQSADELLTKRYLNSLNVLSQTISSCSQNEVAASWWPQFQKRFAQLKLSNREKVLKHAIRAVWAENFLRDTEAAYKEAIYSEALFMDSLVTQVALLQNFAKTQDSKTQKELASVINDYQAFSIEKSPPTIRLLQLSGRKYLSFIEAGKNVPPEIIHSLKSQKTFKKCFDLSVILEVDK